MSSETRLTSKNFQDMSQDSELDQSRRFLIEYITYEPNSDFVLGKRVGRGEVPEVKFSRLVELGRYGQQARVRFPNVKIDIRDSRSVDREFCTN